MRQWLIIAGLGVTGMILVPGCQQADYGGGPPPARAGVTRIDLPAPAGPKPLPAPNPEDLLPPDPYHDEPLVSQRMPEEDAFVHAYNAVGRPKILVFVNRTMEGQLVPVNPNTPDVTVDRQVTGATGYRDSVDVYLHPGQYDEALAKSLDYEAVENILSDWLSASNRVQIVSPILARKRLSDEQVRELQAGRPTVAREIAEELDAHVLVQVQIHPSKQTAQGLTIRLIAEAIDLKHEGASLGRAVVDIPPPLEKQQINYYTRYVARKLMDGMIGGWQVYTNVGQPPASPSPASPLPAPSGQATPPPIWPHDATVVPTPTAPPAPAVTPGPETVSVPVAPPVNIVVPMPVAPPPAAQAAPGAPVPEATAPASVTAEPAPVPATPPAPAPDPTPTAAPPATAADAVSVPTPPPLPPATAPAAPTSSAPADQSK